MKIHRITASALLVLIAVLCPAPCILEEDIKVGALLPLTGKLGAFGVTEQRSMRMAVEKINAQGGVHGNTLQLIVKDTHGNPATGRTAMKNLASQNAFIIGGISSSVTWTAAPIAQKSKIPFLVATASADRITESGGDYIFRLSPPVSEQAEPLYSFLTKIAQVKTVGIFYENTLFGQSRAKIFIKQCNKMGLKIVSKECYPSGTNDYEPFLSRIKAIVPELFFMICSSAKDAASIVDQAVKVSLNAPLYVGDGAVFTRPEFQQYAGHAAEHVFAVTPWTPSLRYPGAKAYDEEFRSRYHTAPDYHGAQAYAAVQVIADVLERAVSHEPQDIKRALEETDLMTVYGPVKFISYGKKRHQNKTTTFLGQWRHDQFEAVWPEAHTSVDYVYPKR